LIDAKPKYMIMTDIKNRLWWIWYKVRNAKKDQRENMLLMKIAYYV